MHSIIRVRLISAFLPCPGIAAATDTARDNRPPEMAIASMQYLTTDASFDAVQTTATLHYHHQRFPDIIDDDRP